MNMRILYFKFIFFLFEAIRPLFHDIKEILIAWHMIG
jgi:hypothetical protein